MLIYERNMNFQGTRIRHGSSSPIHIVFPCYDIAIGREESVFQSVYQKKRILAMTDIRKQPLIIAKPLMNPPRALSKSSTVFPVSVVATIVIAVPIRLDSSRIAARFRAVKLFMVAITIRTMKSATSSV